MICRLGLLVPAIGSMCMSCVASSVPLGGSFAVVTSVVPLVLVRGSALRRHSPLPPFSPPRLVRKSRNAEKLTQLS